MTRLPIEVTMTVTKLGRGPGALQLAGNFARAAAQHVRAGSPQATDEQVAERFSICQSCELFKLIADGQGQCLHPSCGCNLKKVGLTGLNKLRWAEQACPIGKWPAVSSAIIDAKEPTP